MKQKYFFLVSLFFICETSFFSQIVNEGILQNKPGAEVCFGEEYTNKGGANHSFINNGTTESVSGTTFFSNTTNAIQTISESTFFKFANGKKDDPVKEVEDERLKIRVSLETEHIKNKQILLTIDERATDGIDKGFDAQPFDLLNNDIYWVVADKKLIIQALGELVLESVIPIGIITQGATELKIKVDTIQNPYPDMEVYIRDNLTMETYDIKNGTFEVSLEKGECNDSYSVVFMSNEASLSENEILLDNLQVFVGENNRVISIRKPGELIIEGVSLYNIIGQPIKIWDSNLNENEIDLSINVDTGAYLVVIYTNNGNRTKRIIIK